MRYSLLLICGLLIYTMKSYGQWAPNDAIWHYGVIESVFASQQGYEKAEVVGDTIINSRICKKLRGRRYGYNNQLVSEKIWITFSDSDKVYLQTHGTFKVLYDFSANVGDTWNAPTYDAAVACCPWDTTVLITVDSISSMVISGYLKKVLYVHSDSIFSGEFLNPLIEDIGGAGYLLPFPYSYLDGDIPYFRCYEGGGISYQPTSFNCEETIVKVETEKGISVSIFPNPASESIRIMGIPPSQDINLLVFDNTGKQCLSEDINEESVIKTSNWPNGMYMFRFYSSDSIFNACKLFIKY